MNHHLPASFAADSSVVASGERGQLAHRTMFDQMERLQERLYTVDDGVWCVVGNGLSNQTFVRGPDGLVAIGHRRVGRGDGGRAQPVAGPHRRARRRRDLQPLPLLHGHDRADRRNIGRDTDLGSRADRRQPRPHGDRGEHGRRPRPDPPVRRHAPTRRPGRARRGRPRPVLQEPGSRGGHGRLPPADRDRPRGSTTAEIAGLRVELSPRSERRRRQPEHLLSRPRALRQQPGVAGPVQRVRHPGRGVPRPEGSC